MLRNVCEALLWRAHDGTRSRSNTNYLIVLVGIVRIRRSPIRAQTAKEMAGLGTEKMRINEDLAHMAAPVTDLPSWSRT